MVGGLCAASRPRRQGTGAVILYQLVIVPLLLLFAWGYFAMRPATGRGPGMVAFDAVVVVAAVLSSVAAGWWVSVLDPVPDSSVWSVVMVTVSTFHVFPGVLLLGWYLRRRIFQGR